VIQLDEFELWRDRGDDAPLIIRGEARVPENPLGAVVVCHGFKGFARFSFFPHVATELANAGFTAITFDFSGSGVGEDRENFTNRDAFTNNTFLQELGDLEAVVEESRVRDWIKGGYGLFGHSRGGGTAILQAARDHSVEALVTWAAISHVNRWGPDVQSQWRETGFIDVPNARTGDIIPLHVGLLDQVQELGETALNIPAAAEKIRAPWLIVHGSEDETVPVNEAETLASLAHGNAKLRILDKVNHSFGGKHPLTEVTPTLESVTKETVEFFENNLAPSQR